jgi:uncharacterized cofD-like protein
MAHQFEGIHIVTIGGGTGPFAINQYLKSYAHVTAIPGMWDNGGSTGILRDEMGVLPPGDARQSLVSLADNDDMRIFFNHRLQNGPCKNHAVGNIFLSGLEELTGSFAKAVEMASQVLNIRGEVIPVTTDKVNLCLRQRNGKIIRGEKLLGEECNGKDFFEKNVAPDLFFEPVATLNPKAKIAIENADLVVICPGKLYSSVGPHLLVKGLKEALQSYKGKKVYICNLMSLPGQTDGYRVTDYVNALEKLAEEPIFDYVIYNNQRPDQKLLKLYARKGEAFVEFSPEDFKDKHYEAIGTPLLGGIYQQNTNDLLKRTLIRHDGEKVARLLMSIAFKPR